jgi:hypothetical protein
MAEADRKPRIDGGAAVARTLAAAKVKTIFALHGGHLDAAFKGFLDEGIELVDTRHEACAGHAAEGWARLTGGLGVCMITAGPGFTNALTSMANARLDGVPVLFLAGAPPLRESRSMCCRAASTRSPWRRRWSSWPSASPIRTASPTNWPMPSRSRWVGAPARSSSSCPSM